MAWHCMPALWPVLDLWCTHKQVWLTGTQSLPWPPLPPQLLAMRVGFAAAQATQNPICFSLIPELFPKNRTTAMAVYNTAIYAGRALSFAALILAGQLGVPQVCACAVVWAAGWASKQVFRAAR